MSDLIERLAEIETYAEANDAIIIAKAADEIEQLEVMHKNRGTMIAERDAEIERLQSLYNMGTDLGNEQRKEIERLNLKLDVYKRYRVENRKLEAELKQANAVVEAARRAVEAGCWSTGQTQENVLIEALAAFGDRP